MCDDPISTLVLFVVVMRHCVTLQHFHYCIVRFSPIASRSNYFIAIGFSESRKGYFDTLYALDGGKAPRSERPKAKVLIHKQVRQSAFSAIHNSMSTFGLLNKSNFTVDTNMFRNSDFVSVVSIKTH